MNIASLTRSIHRVAVKKQYKARTTCRLIVPIDEKNTRQWARKKKDIDNFHVREAILSKSLIFYYKTVDKAMGFISRITPNKPK